MTRVLERLVAAFVAPVEREERAAGGWLEPAPPGPSSLAVLVQPEQAVAVGGAVALACGGVTVVGVWGARTSGPRAPASPRARRLAAKLAGRGHDAAASGRLVLVALDTPEELTRAAVAVEVPTVLVVAGPRDAQVDRVLAQHDRVIVAGDDTVAALAAESVRALGVPAETLALPDAAPARILAASGAGLVAPWRAPVEEARA